MTIDIRMYNAVFVDVGQTFRSLLGPNGVSYVL